MHKKVCQKCLGWKAMKKTQLICDDCKREELREMKKQKEETSKTEIITPKAD